MEWYYALNGQQHGPVNETEFQRLISTGVIRPDTLVWRNGLAEWQPCANVRFAGAPAGAGGVVCAQCGGTFPPDQVMSFGAASVCATCKPVYVQRLREGLPVGAAPSLGVVQYAGFWIRFAAKFVDELIIAVPTVPISLVFGVDFPLNFNTPAGSDTLTKFIVTQLALMAFGILVRVVYNTFFIGKYAATPGKMLCKIKVVVTDGSHPTYLRAFGRSWAELLSQMVCYVGYIIAGFDDEKRSLHDHICDTRVIFK